MFLVPLDRRRGWYRYHALFREFLLGELRRVEPDVIPKLHLRAADWYEANGIAGVGGRALVAHERTGSMRSAGDDARSSDAQPRATVDGRALALGAR